MEKEPVPNEITVQLTKWNTQAKMLRGIHILLGLIAIIASVTVASRLFPADSNIIAWIAWSAAISAAILTNLNLGAKSNNMRNAWRKLNAAVLRYRTEGDKFTIKDLNDAYENGEKTIGDVEVDVSATGGR